MNRLNRVRHLPIYVAMGEVPILAKPMCPTAGMKG
jgi:hypothetical protein